MHFDGDERRSGARVGIGAGGGPLRELVSIALNDRPLCEVGLEMLAKECERVAKKCRLIRVSTAEVDRRAAECADLIGRLRPDNEVAAAALDLGVPAQYIPTLLTGLSLEYEALTATIEDQQELVLDTSESERRRHQLDRLMSDLDVATMGAAA